MIHVLHYVSGLADIKAGVETYILNINRNMDKSEYKFTLLTRNAKKTSELYKEFIANGIEVIDLECPHLGLKTLFPYYKKLKAFFAKRHDFAFLHFHGCDDPFVISMAKSYGIKNCAVHIHSAERESSGKILGAAKRFFAMQNISKAGFLFAAGEQAGRNMLKNKSFTVLKNTIDTEAFRFDPVESSRIRTELGFSERDFVFFYSGRLVQIKNLFFMLDVFAEIRKLVPEAKMLIAGDGELLDSLLKYSAEKGLSDCVRFLGSRSDIAQLLSASDAYLQCSISESFSFSALEAQCSGLPVFISSGFPKEIEITDLVTKEALSASSMEWAEDIKKKLCDSCFENREKYADIIAESGYDSYRNSKAMLKIYRQE